MPGYPREILVDDKKFQDHLVCCICNLLLRNAVQSICGHRYCHSCVEDHIRKRLDEGEKPQCPACPENSEDGILNEKQIYPDFHARKELKNMPVKCINNGCQWKGKFQKYVEHESECDREVIKCLKAGCGKSLRRADLVYHLEKDCPMRPVRCRNCGQELASKQIKKHNSECPKMGVPCSDCGKKIPRESLKAHQDFKTGECPNRKQYCVYANYGCSFTISGNGMNEHLQNELVYHLQLQNEKFDELLEEYTARLESLQNKQKIGQGISFAKTKLSENVESACAKLDSTSLELTGDDAELSGAAIDNLKTMFKQWFVTKEEQNETEEKSKISGKSNSASPKMAMSTNQRVSQALDMKIRSFEVKFKESYQDLTKLKTLYAVLDKRHETFQEVVAVLNKQLEMLVEKTHRLERQNQHLRETIEQQDRQIHAHDQMLTVKSVALAEQELRIQSLELSAFNGILVWKISDYAQRKQYAASGKTTSFYSHPFYTSYHGYKMCARIYLMGDGMGKGSHVSLFFVIMKGRYDNILHWPFKQKVTFMMVDQGNREHVVDSFRPDPNSSSFKKPTHEMNVASGCPLFISLTLLENANYSFVKDDCIFVKVIVDVTDLEKT